MSKTILVDIDNTVADYTNGLRDYIRECGRGEDECPCPEPTAYDFTLTGGWPFSGNPKAFTWWHTRASPTACTPEKNRMREPSKP